ncbi:methanogenesis marker 12 protein [Methanobrevibacter boviskoreani]|uniref:methanogenesis marker 12 protein n=1 Tax=Methanobrevibacter boviskoreani TaxID=1348249 RepID=UPI0023A89F49|nr:methanogenesis marker 12 protein [Methanobrevibacter boviskoreani]MCI6774195.1 methanogenesis marker 12 protein [Methanobrevibacter boviskoreani]MDY5613687.1 methanogenesis marker 12 protein [Methanobrevibacter boviskoreani]
MVFIGMDHGTTGITFALLDDDGNVLDVFELSREDTKAGRVSAIEEISKRCSLDDIKLMIVTYSMGDGINKITPMDKVENRGILSMEGAGKVTGGGTSVYSEIEKSNIPALLIPGLHKNSPSLDKLFNAAYSHQASPEKVSIVYNAVKETGWKNMIVCDLSSNSVDILVEDGKIRGAIDACLGAMGFVHGPLDLEMIRDIDEGKRTANECFSHAGAVKIAGIDDKVAYMKRDLLEQYEEGEEKAVLAVDSMVMTIAMEIFGLIGISNNDIDGIVLTGSLGSMKEPFDFEEKLNKYLKNRYDIKIISADSGAIGAAQIARDIYNGKKNILGIDVDY